MNEAAEVRASTQPALVVARCVATVAEAARAGAWAISRAMKRDLL
jgi:hypothetical protein